MVARYPVVLASESPRRRELLSKLFDKFEVVPSGVPEEMPEHGEPERVAKRLARAKALGVAIARPDALVIGADTVVAVGGRLLEKPATHEDAVRMLMLLSGREHTVTTGVALVWPAANGVAAGKHAFADTVVVRFRRFSKEEANAYVETGEPMDKAGAYAIQGGAAQLVELVHGDTDTVIGLPVAPLREILVRLRLVVEFAER
ncbi:MAG: septum formation protein Maf [Armatimonadota bacterium]